MDSDDEEVVEAGCQPAAARSRGTRAESTNDADVLLARASQLLHSMLRTLEADHAASLTIERDIHDLIDRVTEWAKSRKSQRKEKRDLVGRLIQLGLTGTKGREYSFTSHGYQLSDQPASRSALGITSFERQIFEMTKGISDYIDAIEAAERLLPSRPPPTVSHAATQTTTIPSYSSPARLSSHPINSTPEFMRWEHSEAIPTPAPILRLRINSTAAKENRTTNSGNFPPQDPQTMARTNMPLRQDDSRIVYVLNLPYSATPEDIREIFSNAGEVIKIKIFEGRGRAFCEFADRDGFLKALNRIHGNSFRGRTIFVQRARATRIY